MKKLYFFISILAITSGIHAQATYFEDFESGSMPEDYILINADGLTPQQVSDSIFKTLAWAVFFSNSIQSHAAFSVSWYVNDDGPADDWMILPKMTIGTNAILSWKAKSGTTSGNFPDSYEILINPGEPSKESFVSEGTVLRTITNETHLAPSSREVSLANWSGQTVHIAFRNITPSGASLLVDDIMITNILTTSTRDENNDSVNLQVFPNPVSDKLSFAFNPVGGGKVTASLYNIDGKVMLTKTKDMPISHRQIWEMDTSVLPSGMYKLVIRENQMISSASVQVIK